MLHHTVLPLDFSNTAYRLYYLGFGPQGIIVGSIAAWFQSNYGISFIFSLLQSIGAHGGLVYPKTVSFIVGSIYRYFPGLEKFKPHSCISSKVVDPKTNLNGYFWTITSTCVDLMPLVAITAFLYYKYWRDNPEHTTNNDHAQRNTSLPQRQNLAKSAKQIHQRDNFTYVQNGNGNSPRKITELLERNNKSNYNCPKCKKEFRPQGISRHAISCATKWCKTNGIRIH